MENSDKEKIERIIKTRKKAHSFYSWKSKVYESFVEMEHRTYKNSKLSKLQKELIAVGISVVIDCESCMEWHIVLLKNTRMLCLCSCRPGGNRTLDPMIKSHVLCQLSYGPDMAAN